MIAEQGQQALARNCASTFSRETLGWSQERQALSRQIASAHSNEQPRHQDPNSSSVSLCWNCGRDSALHIARISCSTVPFSRSSPPEDAIKIALGRYSSTNSKYSSHDSRERTYDDFMQESLYLIT